MIVRMKKVTLLTSTKQKQEFLMRLRKLGTVHIRHISKPSADEIQALENTISHVKKATSTLNEYKDHDSSGTIGWGIDEVSKNAEEVISLAKEKEDAVKGLEDVKNQMEWFKPWGAFNPQDIQILEQKGVFVKLYRAPKSVSRKIRKQKDIYLIKKDRQYIYFAQILNTPEEALPFEEVQPAKESFGELSNKREALQTRIDEINELLRVKARAVDSLKESVSKLEGKHNFLHVMHGMRAERGFSYLQGFCPIEKVKDIIALAKSQGTGYLIEDPDKPEDAPTLIRNPKWINIINPVFKFMNTIPGYQEYDISLWFLFFFSVFFAMLIGDAAYGLLFVVITFFARKKMKNIPPEPFWLMYTLGFATIIWGAITGTWFGVEKIAEMPFFSSLVIGKVNSFVDSNQNFMIFMCFIIGVVHLSIAHLIRGWRLINSVRALGELGWVLVLWGLFFAAGTLVIDRPFPQFAGYLLISGVSMVLLFSNPQKNVIKGILISLGNIPLKIIGSFADVVSYLRLFAVGYASVVLASTFNAMAMNLGFNSAIAGLGAAFILFFGHSLNIVLGLMAVIVHGIRLNMLEFSGQMGMEWAGKEYSPFREKEAVG